MNPATGAGGVHADTGEQPRNSIAADSMPLPLPIAFVSTLATGAASRAGSRETGQFSHLFRLGQA